MNKIVWILAALVLGSVSAQAGQGGVTTTMTITGTQALMTQADREVVEAKAKQDVIAKKEYILQLVRKAIDNNRDKVTLRMTSCTSFHTSISIGATCELGPGVDMKEWVPSSGWSLDQRDAYYEALETSIQRELGLKAELHIDIGYNITISWAKA